MSETCVVYGKGKGPEKCEVCGFSDNGFINRQFPIPEDTKNWIETVVKPYRMQWEVKSNAKDLIKSGEGCDDSDNAEKLYDAAINLLNTVIMLNPKDASAFALRGKPTS